MAAAHVRAMARWRVRGFTIVELLCVVSVVSVLLTIAVPAYELSVRREREVELTRALREIRSALDSYKRSFDEGRVTKREGDSGYPATLEVLVIGVPDATSPKGAKLKFLRRVPTDPIYGQASWGLRSYESDAERPAPGKDVFDVYSLATGKGLNGVAYNKW